MYDIYYLIPVLEQEKRLDVRNKRRRTIIIIIIIIIIIARLQIKCCNYLMFEIFKGSTLL